MNTVASRASSPSPELSEAARIVKVFLEPGKAFASLDRKPRWWAPWLLISAANAVFSFILIRRVDLLRLARREMEQSQAAQQVFSRLTPAQQEAQLQLSAAIYKAAAYLAPLITLLEVAVIALLLILAFRIFFKIRIQWSRGLAVVSYALLPQIVFTAIACFALARTPDPDLFDLHNPVASNPAYLLGSDNNSSFTYGLLEGLDIGNLWIVVLLGIGFAQVAENRRLAPGTAVGTIAGLYTAYVIAHSIVASLG